MEVDGSREQLQALSSDSAEPFETVIADNGSTDDSVAIAQAFAQDIELVVVDASGSKGQAYARNLGARTATGKYLLFLDQDDEVGPGYVSVMATALDRAEFVAARMEDHKLNHGWRQQARTLPQTEHLPTDPIPWAYGCTLGVRRTTFERLGGFPEDLAAPPERTSTSAGPPTTTVSHSRSFQKRLSTIDIRKRCVGSFAKA